jgi:molecular chaperone DnaK
MIVGGFVEAVIPQNSSVPTSRSKIFTTVKDNQTAVKILVLQGESERADENELLGEFIMSGLREAPKGQVEIEVTFDINADGIVSVSAKDLETNKEQSITVTASSGLTDDEIRQMTEESQDYLVERQTSEEFERLRQDAERTIRDLERMFGEVESMVTGSEFGQEALEKARNIIDRARKAIITKDKEQLRTDVEALGRTLKMFKGVLAKS